MRPWITSQPGACAPKTLARCYVGNVNKRWRMEPTRLSVPGFHIQPEGECPAFIRPRRRPRQQHMGPASASQAMCEDGPRYSSAAKPLFFIWPERPPRPRKLPNVLSIDEVRRLLEMDRAPDLNVHISSP
jgi:hypothetical protein